MLPHSPACERNREPILSVLREFLDDRRRLLEIGSGTGQHAVHFAAAMPWLLWQCTDRAEQLPGIQAWLEQAGLSNTPRPLALDVAVGPWPTPAPARAGSRGESDRFDAVFSANTLHIMGWSAVEALFAEIDTTLAADATVVIYGPFNYDGGYTSDSNRQFDGWLRARDGDSGIRDFEAVDRLARAIGLRLHDDRPMPANNRCLVWQRGN